jgi:hypothetical protein
MEILPFIERVVSAVASMSPSSPRFGEGLAVPYFTSVLAVRAERVVMRAPTPSVCVHVPCQPPIKLRAFKRSYFARFVYARPKNLTEGSDFGIFHHGGKLRNRPATSRHSFQRRRSLPLTEVCRVVACRPTARSPACSPMMARSPCFALPALLEIASSADRRVARPLDIAGLR